MQNILLLFLLLKQGTDYHRAQALVREKKRTLVLRLIYLNLRLSQVHTSDESENKKRMTYVNKSDSRTALHIRLMSIK